MGLHQEANQILSVLYKDFNRKGFSIECLKRNVDSAKDSIHIPPDDLDIWETISSPNTGMNKDKIFEELNFRDNKSFENALYYLEMSKGFVEYADNDLPPEPSPGHIISEEDAIGHGPRKHLRLTMSGYLEADNINQPKTSFIKYFHFVDKTFYIETIGGETESWYLSAPTKYTLLLALVTILNKKGKIIDGWASVYFSKSELSSMLREINPKLPLQLQNWIKNTKGNFNRTISKNIKELIVLPNFDRTSQTYNFKIKLPI